MRRTLLTVLFSISLSFLLGQSKWSMIGEYQHSIFMYSYKLTLKDGENFEIEESSDLGSEKIIGTWTIRGQAIILAPKTKITTDINKRQNKWTGNELKEKVMVIETKDILKPAEKNFKLERIK